MGFGRVRLTQKMSKVPRSRYKRFHAYFMLYTAIHSSRLALSCSLAVVLLKVHIFECLNLAIYKYNSYDGTSASSSQSKLARGCTHTRVSRARPATVMLLLLTRLVLRHSPKYELNLIDLIEL